MTENKLLEAFTTYTREAKRNTRLAEAARLSLVSQINKGRAINHMTVKQLAEKAKIKMPRAINVLYNDVALKPSEAKALLQAING